jgi:hypothetical protein
MYAGRWAVPTYASPTSIHSIFTNDANVRLLSTFFSSGQTLATYRHGAGIFQPALDDAITLLSQSNAWLHVFPEGRIRQSKDYSSKSSVTLSSC